MRSIIDYISPIGKHQLTNEIFEVNQGMSSDFSFIQELQNIKKFFKYKNMENNGYDGILKFNKIYKNIRNIVYSSPDYSIAPIVFKRLKQEDAN